MRLNSSNRYTLFPVGEDQDSSLSDFILDEQHPGGSGADAIRYMLEDNNSGVEFIFANSETMRTSEREKNAIALSRNAIALSRIDGFDIETVPRELCCSISFEIMDEPVYDPNYPKIKFEKENILKWLRNKSIHPVARTYLVAENLVNDEDLKNQIACYINDCKKYARNETYCGFQQGFLIGKTF